MSNRVFTRVLGFLLFGVMLLTALEVRAQSSNELKLGSAAAGQGVLASIPLTLSTTDEVEGLVATFEWDGSVGAGEALTPGAAVSTADTVVTRVEDAYMVMGVVVDSDGDGPSFILPGDGLLVATVGIRVPSELDADKSTDIRFVESKYASVEGGPLLDNLVAVGGESITKDEGLVLTDGQLTAKVGAAEFVFKLENGSSSESRSCGPVRVLMDSTRAVEGYEVALAHPEGLTLDSVKAGSAALDNGADFVAAEIVDGGGTVGVVLDLVEPFENNSIPAGEGLEIAVYSLCCKDRPGPADEPVTYDLTFVDGELGDPAKSNAVVVEGVSFAPVLQNGTFTCTPASGVEICDDQIDNDQDGDTDCDDADCAGDPACEVGPGEPAFSCGGAALDADGLPLPAQGVVGGTATVSFYYKAPGTSVQGLSMAICNPCDVRAQEGTFDTTGTIVEAVGAEYVSHQVDNDPDDGDGCELIIGILVDNLPPFDGKTLPATEDFLSIGRIEYKVEDDSRLCGECLDVSFCDGINGGGKVPISNLISVENESRSVALVSCEICIGEEGVFHRGDCNYSNRGSLSVDIADAAATVSFLMDDSEFHFEPQCLDACDCNDDGRIDLADVTCVLKFLFEFGVFPPAPGPGFDESGQETPPGLDPTPDELDCSVGGSCE